MSHRKRKHRQRSDTYSNQYDPPATPSSTRPDPSLFIVAHEADIIRGPQAARIADSLEIGINVDGQGGSRVGDSLIKWECKVGGSAEGGDMWVDRYDARLLLDALAPSASIVDNAASNDDAASVHSGGWSDLPSDAEDTFFLTPEETADLHRTKRLRYLDALRTARLRALSPEMTDLTDGDPNADPWGGSDEEPDEQQMELMSRTAAHIVRATNDAQLRARILAHHGADMRFAFLRGRWGQAWARAQADANRAVLAEREKAQSAGALGGITGYGSGSEEDAEDDDDIDEDGVRVGGGGLTEHAQVLGEEAPEDGQATQEAEPEELALRTAQEARRAKAREWAEKRRVAKALALAEADEDKNK